MNKIFTLIVFISFTFLLKAQEESDSKKNDISIGMGFFTLGTVIESVNDFKFAFFGETEESKVIFPLTFISYKKSIDQKWDVEGLIGYEKYSAIRRDLRKNQISSSSSFFGIGLGVNFNYVKTKVFQIYSGVNSILLVITNTRKEKDTLKEKDSQFERRPSHSIHITALGVRLGDRFAVNSEIGLGYKGNFNIGFSYRF